MNMSMARGSCILGLRTETPFWCLQRYLSLVSLIADQPLGTQLRCSRRLTDRGGITRRVSTEAPTGGERNVENLIAPWARRLLWP